jgi:hypothetical protein
MHACMCAPAHASLCTCRQHISIHVQMPVLVVSRVLTLTPCVPHPSISHVRSLVNFFTYLSSSQTLSLLPPFFVNVLSITNTASTTSTFSALFLAECAAKIVALGFVMGKHTYLSEPWNWLDFVVVIIGVIDFFPSDGSSNLSALRAMRVLRPLRLVTKFPELRDVVRYDSQKVIFEHLVFFCTVS